MEISWDSKGRKSFGRAQGRRVKGVNLRALNSELVSSLEKGLRLALEEYKL